MAKRNYILLFFVLCFALATSAQPADGYYRLKNKVTGEYAALASDVLSYDKALYDIGVSGLSKDGGKATAVAKMGCYLQNDIRMTDAPNTTPGTVFYIKTTTSGTFVKTKKTNLYGQGTSLYDITEGVYTGSSTFGNMTFGGFYTNLTSKNGGGYTLHIKVSYTAFSMGDYYFKATDHTFGVEKDAGNKDYAQWYLEKATTFNVAPLSKVKDANGHYYTTLCVDFPFSIPSSGSTVVAAYTVTGKDEKGNAVLTPLTGTIAGGTPCIIECSSDNAETNILNIGSAEPANKSCADGETVTSESNYLYGRYFNAPEASYQYLNTYKSPSVTESLSTEKNVLKNDKTNFRVLNCVNGVVGFYTLKNANATMGANKAFLNIQNLPTVSDAATRVFSVQDPDGVTAISRPSTADAPAVIYDLQGRRVAAPKRHGIYIVNGKKVTF